MCVYVLVLCGLIKRFWWKASSRCIRNTNSWIFSFQQETLTSKDDVDMSNHKAVIKSQFSTILDNFPCRDEKSISTFKNPWDRWICCFFFFADGFFHVYIQGAQGLQMETDDFCHFHLTSTKIVLLCWHTPKISVKRVVLKNVFLSPTTSGLKVKI